MVYGLGTMLAGSMIPTPLYPLYQQLWRLSPGMLTAIYGVYVLGILATLQFAAPAAERFGHRPVLLTGLTFSALSATLSIFAGSVGWMLAARVAQGVAIGTYAGIAADAMTVTAEERDPATARNRASIVLAATTSAGLAIGPLASAALATFAPGPLVLPYAVQLVCLAPAVAGVALACWTRPQRDDVAIPQPAGGRLSPADKHALLASGLVGFFAFATVGLYSALGAALLRQALGDVRAPLLAGGALVALVFGSSALLQRWGMDRRRETAIGVSVTALGLALTTTAAVAELRWWALAVGAALTGVGHGLAFKGSFSFLSACVPGGTRARKASAYFTYAYVGGVLPVVGAGFLIGRLGFAIGLIAFAAITMAGLLGSVLLVQSIRRSTARSARVAGPTPSA